MTGKGYMIVDSTGLVTFCDENQMVQKRETQVYLHFLESCMQNYFEGCFASSSIMADADKIQLLKREKIKFSDNIRTITLY